MQQVASEKNLLLSQLIQCFENIMSKSCVDPVTPMADIIHMTSLKITNKILLFVNLFKPTCNNPQFIFLIYNF
jgi:hypothetical protein